MSKTIRCTPDTFRDAMKQAIKMYGDHAFEIAEGSAKTAGRQATSELKSTSPVGVNGTYARGWSHKALRQGVLSYTEIVYNRTDYQLTHLLEKPHPVNGPGKYPTYKDHTGLIAKVEDKYGIKFYEGVVDKL